MRWVLPDASVVLVVIYVVVSREVVGEEDRWRQPSRDLPSLLGESTSTALPRSWHFTKSPRVAEAVGVWLAFFPFVLIASPGREELGAKKVSQGPCAGGSKDLLAMIELPLLVGEGARASPPPLGFNLLPLSLPNPCCMPPPTFRIMSATRKNSFSLEIR